MKTKVVAVALVLSFAAVTVGGYLLGRSRGEKIHFEPTANRLLKESQR